MTTPVLPSARIHGPGDLVAAVPHLLGFHPTDSVVVLVLRGDSVAVVLRADLPDVEQLRDAAEKLVPVVRRNPGCSVAVLVVGGGGADPPEVLPRPDVVRSLLVRLDALRVPLARAVWAPGTSGGEPWFDYADVGRTGTAPDARATYLAALSAAAGHVTYGSRAEMAELLSPDPPEALARRAALLDRLTAALESADPDELVARHRRALLAAVERTPSRTTPLPDDEVAELAFALSSPRVRDLALTLALGAHAMAAERLWTELTRAAPAPERAEAAALLAFATYLRGEGALAVLALERAEAASPGHRMTTLLRGALQGAMPPDYLRSLAEEAARAYPS
ncbi:MULTISPECIES: DUF4192 domain-containing protein [Actinosynnema]|uniref:DUF4192 domain-containing protein n=1 Tax=Actinosynnema TaxID=40566 RepID=UPI0020A5410D|nr:DUF4192 domain-containing protein [Actinosynnema pretiosum]MCP2093238.1 protein of unknown function (DUF4192) [Actinosynnema pretiosum]